MKLFPESPFCENYSYLRTGAGEKKKKEQKKKSSFEVIEKRNEHLGNFKVGAEQNLFPKSSY